MINADGIYKDERTGKWKVYFGGEWLYTVDTYEEADDLLTECYLPDDEDDCPDWYEADPEREAYGISGWSADPWDDLGRDLNDRYYLIFE